MKYAFKNLFLKIGRYRKGALIMFRFSSAKSGIRRYTNQQKAVPREYGNMAATKNSLLQLKNKCDIISEIIKSDERDCD